LSIDIADKCENVKGKEPKDKNKSPKLRTYFLPL
jgi:hypothetical protein